jgi:hypothetical protein
VCIPLFDPDARLDLLKRRVADYPEALRRAVVQDYLWAAEFGLAAFAPKFATRSDGYGTIDRDRADAVFDQPACELGVIGGGLAADADGLPRALRCLDITRPDDNRHGEIPTLPGKISLPHHRAAVPPRGLFSSILDFSRP